MEPSFLDAAVRTGLYLARRATWHAGECAWPAGDGDAADVYDGSAGIGWFLAELDRVAPHPALRRAAEGALRHALGAAGEMEGPHAASFYHGRVGVAYAAARAGALWDRDDLGAAAEALVGSLADAGIEDAPAGVRYGIAGAVPALLAWPGPRDGPCRALAERLGERILERAEREVWGWSWTDAGEVNVRPLTGLGHGASGVGRASLELFRVVGDGRHRYAAEQSLLYERRFFEPSSGAWFDLRHLRLTTLLQRDGAQALAERVRQEGGGVPWLGRFAFGWCHGAVGIGLVRLRAWEILGRAGDRAEAEAAVGATLANTAAQVDPGLCHGTAGDAELLVHAARALDRPEWHGTAEEVAARLMRSGRLGALRAARAEQPLAGGVMVGEAGAGWLFLRLADPAVPSVLLPGAAPGDGRAAAAGAEAPAGYAAARRAHVDRYFGTSLAALERLEGSGEGDSGTIGRAARDAERGAGGDRSAPLAVYRALRAAADAAPDSPAAASVAVDCARFELLLGVTDLAEEGVEAWRRPPAEAIGWSAATLLQLARGARHTGAVLLVRGGMRVAEHPLGALEAAVVTGVSRKPATVAELAEDAARPVDEVAAAARALYQRGAVDVLPGPTLADAVAAGVAAAVTEEIPDASYFRGGAAQVRGSVGAVWEQAAQPRLAGDSDPLLPAYLAESATAQLQRALAVAAVEPLFRDDMEACWRAESVDDRRRALAGVCAVLRRVFGYPPLLRAVYLSAPLTRSDEHA